MNLALKTLSVFLLSIILVPIGIVLFLLVPMLITVSLMHFFNFNPIVSSVIGLLITLAQCIAMIYYLENKK